MRGGEARLARLTCDDPSNQEAADCQQDVHVGCGPVDLWTEDCGQRTVELTKGFNTLMESPVKLPSIEHLVVIWIFYFIEVNHGKFDRFMLVLNKNTDILGAQARTHHELKVEKSNSSSSTP